MILDAQIVAEEKGPVLADRSSHRAAKVIVGEMAARGIVPVPGRECAHAVELIRRTVNLIGTRLQEDVDDPAGGASQLRFEIAGADIHGLDGLLRRWRPVERSGAAGMLLPVEGARVLGAGWCFSTLV